MKVMKWLADHSGDVIKNTAIAAGTVIGLTLVSVLASDDETGDELIVEAGIENVDEWKETEPETTETEEEK